MIGQKILEMKMNSNIIKRKKDILKIPNGSIVRVSLSFEPKEKRRYLVSNIKKTDKSISLLPLEGFFENSIFKERPLILFPISSINSIEILPKEDLLFLINHYKNPHIRKAIEGYYE
jgi:hypothetical protein